MILGRPYPVVTKLDGQGCMPGYDSHVCLVNGFLPCGPNEEPTGDEIVIFRSEQILPRYVGKTSLCARAYGNSLWLHTRLHNHA